MTYFGNKYSPDRYPPDIPWHERDNFLTWYDQNKYAEFSKKPDEYLKNKKVINFNMINAQCRGEKRQYFDKHYQTVVKKMPQRGKKNDSWCLFPFGYKRYVYVKKKLTLSHFLDKEKL